VRPFPIRPSPEADDVAAKRDDVARAVRPCCGAKSDDVARQRWADLGCDPAVAGGGGPLISGLVTRLYRNVTDTVLSVNGVLTTPGHHWLSADGRIERIDDIIARGAVLVDAAGEARSGEIERFVFREETARQFEVATDRLSPEAGALALQPEMRTGWRTYNFEVERLHTYVAGGYRVHSRSAPDLVPLDGNDQKLPFIVTDFTLRPSDGKGVAPDVVWTDHRGDEHIIHTAPSGPNGESVLVRETIYEKESGAVRDWVTVSRTVDDATGVEQSARSSTSAPTAPRSPSRRSARRLARISARRSPATAWCCRWHRRRCSRRSSATSARPCRATPAST
jgi:hypothetical protein